jgi:hypothetical protein
MQNHKKLKIMPIIFNEETGQMEVYHPKKPK